MKKIAVAIASLLTLAATSVLAEQEGNYPYDVERVQREQAREAYRNNSGYDEGRWRDDRWREKREWSGAPRECWNPRARHFEGVREGERQDDLDFSRCRIVSDGTSSRRWR